MAAGVAGRGVSMRMRSLASWPLLVSTTAAFIPEPIRQRLAKEFGEQPGVIAAGSTDWPSQATVELSRSASDAVDSTRLRENLSQAAKAAAEETSIPS